MSKKSRRLESLFLLSKIISTPGDNDKIKQDILSADIDWLTIVEIANTYYLTAALYYSLLEKDLLKYIDDKELLAYLEQIYTINLHRNQQIVEQSKEINDRLGEKNIRPVFLKGTASLLQNDYQNIGMRFLSDIDFCIFEKDFQKAKEQLLFSGYTPYITEGKNIEKHHHWWPMTHSDWNVAIEPHKRILAYSYFHFIECNEENVQNSDYYTNLTILTPTFRLIHAFIHSDVVDIAYETKRINLRQLYEQSIIIRKYEKQIDWQYIENILGKHNFLNRFNYNLNLLNDLFGVHAPIMTHNLNSKINLKILYIFFKYKNSFILHSFSNFQIFRFAFSYRTMESTCDLSTKKDYIYCIFGQIKKGLDNWLEGKYKLLP